MPLVQRISTLEKGEKYISNVLLMQHHMGLGDHIHLVGIVRYAILDLGFDSVVVFCKDRNYETVKRLYADTREVTVVSVGSPSHSGAEINFVSKYISEMSESCVYMRLGYENYPWANSRNIGYPSYIFYDMAKVPRDVRWSHFKFDDSKDEQGRVYEKLNPNNEPYIFVHDDASRGFRISVESIRKASNMPKETKIVGNDMSENLLDLALVLKNASEIHCMGSAMYCFADLLTLGDTKCYYHNIRNLYSNKGIQQSDTRHEWVWVNDN